MPFVPNSTLITKGEFVGVTITKGDEYDDDDPIVVAHPDLFTSSNPRPVRSSETSSGYVEDATSRPGEKRSTRRAG